jgi:hypothetical protein
MHVLEVVKFKLNEGVTREKFLEGVSKTNAYISSSKGFIERSVGVSKEDVWTDIVKWEDMESALHAAEAFSKSAEGVEFMAMIDMNSAEMNHFEILA